MSGAPPATGTPSRVEDLAHESRQRTAAHDWEAGLELARRSLAAARFGSAEEAEAQLALGEALFRAGHLEEAGTALRRSLALRPDAAAAWYGLARYLLTVPDYQRAGRALRIAHELDPSDPRVVRRLAALVVSREEAVRLYRLYLRLPPVEDEQVLENARAWLALLESLGERKLYRLEGPPGAREIPLTRARGVPLVDVRLGSLSPRPFLVDSGASGVTVSSTDFHRLGLEPVADFTVRGVSGDTQSVPFILLPDLHIGPFTFHDVPAVVMPARQGGTPIVGLSLLAPLTPGFRDWRRLTLHQGGGAPAGCPQGDWWRFRNVSGFIRIDGRLDGAEVHLMWDTGAARSALSRSLLQRLGLKESPGGAPFGIGGLTGQARDVGRLRSKATLEFLGESVGVRGIAVLDLAHLSRSAGTEIDGILGMDLLPAATYRLDYASGRIQVR